MMFKSLLSLSNKAIISFINGLFGTNYGPDSKVVHLHTEDVREDWSSLISDSMLSIDGTTYNVEVQIEYDADMVVRVFQYGYYGALSQNDYEKTAEGVAIRTVRFPKAKVIYWELGDKTPTKQVLRLEFPDGKTYDYELDSFNLLAHEPEELGEKGLAILIPFYIIKLRKQVKAAATREERKALAQPMLDLVTNLLDLVEHCTEKDFIGYADAQKIITAMERLYKQLYFKYKELREGEKRMNKKFVWPTDKIIENRSIEIARNSIAEGISPDMIVKITGLSLRKVKSLMKQPAQKTPA
jgi:hypothetical protein